MALELLANFRLSGGSVEPLLPQGFEAFDMEEKGAWEELPGGGAALRLSIRSPDAGSHIVVFRCALAVSVVEAMHDAASSSEACSGPWL